MPRIPMADNIGLLNYQMHAVHNQRTPGFDFGTENARAFGNFGKSVENGIENSTKAFMEHNLLQMKFEKEKQDTEDRLAFVQLSNFYNELYDSLDSYIKDNPGISDKEYKSKITEIRGKYIKKADDYLNRMSPDARRTAEEHVNGWNISGDKRRSDILRQNYVSGALKLSEQEENKLLSSGKFDEYKNYVKSQTSLYSSETIELKLNEIPRLKDEWNARKAYDEGELSVSLLKDEKNYPNMSRNYRDSLIQACRAYESEKRSGTIESFLKNCYEGNRYNDEQIKELSGNDDALASSLYRIKNQFASFDESERMKVQARIDKFNLKKEKSEAEIFNKFESFAKISEKQKAKKASSLCDSMELGIYDTSFPSDRNEAITKYNNIKTEIYNCFGAENKDKSLKLIKVLDRVYKDYLSDKSFMDSPGYQYGIRKIGDGNDQDKLEMFYGYDSDAWFFHKADDPDILLTNQQQVRRQFTEWIKSNPNANTSDIDAFIEKSIRDVNAADIKKIVESLNGIKQNSVDTPKNKEKKGNSDADGQNGNMGNGSDKTVLTKLDVELSYSPYLAYKEDAKLAFERAKNNFKYVYSDDDIIDRIMNVLNNSRNPIKDLKNFF